MHIREAEGDGVVSHEVWERLDKRAGMLTRSEARRWKATAAVGAVAGVALVAGWFTGATVPRLEQAQVGVHTYIPLRDDNGKLTGIQIPLSQDLTNKGLLPVTITGAGVTGPGYTLKAVNTRLPLTIPPGGTALLDLDLSVTDCAAAEDVFLVVEVDRWWGSIAVQPGADPPTDFDPDMACWWLRIP
jgi:hypothetical protein